MPEGLTSNLNEEKEVLGSVDFKKIFNDKLANIAPLSEQEDKGFEKIFKNFEIGKIKKKCPAVIFEGFPENKMQLWIADPKNIVNNNYSHYETRKELKNFLETNKLDPTTTQLADLAYIIQDEKEKLFLFFDGQFAEAIKKSIERGKRYDYFFSIKKYEDLMRRYGIEKMIGQFTELTTTSNGAIINSYKTENILNEDVLGEIRENEYLFSYAKKYNMTKNQFINFRIRAIAGREAALKDKEAAERGTSYLINLDDLAKEVIAQDVKENHL